MKTVMKIMKNELKMLFCSPIAWLILVIFAVQAGMAFCDSLGEYLKQVVMGYGLRNLTDGIFCGYRGVYTQLQNNLYFYIPLLTMGIMSREYNSGSIKLLYSSPITNSQIILGKFYALMVYVLVLMLTLLFVFVLAGGIVKSLDFGALMAGVLGLYLLACAYCAIGLYMSTLTSYQVVAAVGTLAVLAILNFIGGVGQDIELVREITYWLSISGRADEMIGGLICSEDVIYFFMVIALFLSLAVIKLNNERCKDSYTKILLRYSCTILLVVAVGYITSRPKMMCYYDATQMKHRTLTPASQDIMEELKNTNLKITTYVNLLEKNYSYASDKNSLHDMRRFEQYLRFKPDIQMKYIYYWGHADNPDLDNSYPDKTDEERAKAITKAWKLNFEDFLTPEQLKKEVDLELEEFRFVRLLEAGNGKKTFLRMFDDMSKLPSETEISAAMKRLIVTPPLYSFIIGHGERDIFKKSDRDYHLLAKQNGFRHALINQGFDTDTLTLANADETANGSTVLVIADPQEPYSREELWQLEHYIETGTNMLITGKPESREFVNPILEMLGLELVEGTLVHKSEEFAADMMFATFSPQGRTFSATFDYFYNQGYKITAPGSAGIRQIADKGFQVVPIVVADSVGYWNELQTKDFINEVPEFNPEKGEIDCGGMPIVTILARQVGDKTQKIVVMGNADCISNGEFSKSRNGVSSCNYNLILETGLWFSDGEFPVNAGRSARPDNELYMKYRDLKWVKYALVGAVPVLLALFGGLIWMKRRRE